MENDRDSGINFLAAIYTATSHIQKIHLHEARDDNMRSAARTRNVTQAYTYAADVNEAKRRQSSRVFVKDNDMAVVPLGHACS